MKFTLHKVQAVTLAIAIIFLFLPEKIIEHQMAMYIVAGILGVNTLIEFFN